MFIEEKCQYWQKFLKMYSKHIIRKIDKDAILNYKTKKTQNRKYI